MSVVFDEVTVKERLVVEGGASGQVLSQFDGPVTFNKEIRSKSQSTFNGKVRITNTSSDALSVSGGVSVSGSEIIDKSLTVKETSTLTGEVTVGTGIIPDTDEGAYLGTSSKPFSDAHIGEIRISQTDDNTIDTVTGPLTLNATNGSKVAISTSATITGDLDMTAGSGILRANYLDVPNITPIGGIIMWPGTVSNFPTGWAVCNGASLSTSAYPNLFNIIGYTFGGSGGTFNLPNMLERFVVGAGGDNPTVTGTSGYGVGDTDGSNSVTLNLTQIPSHEHTVSASGSATKDFAANRNGGYGSGAGGGGLGADTPIVNVTGTAAASGGFNGETQPHENRPPYFALIYLIRIQ
ncbi:MAG: hypothetical protein EBU90_17895 [Proteobacteria bacterium]|nr:hypothetical protein [Pseudomonadota bacterium]